MAIQYIVKNKYSTLEIEPFDSDKELQFNVSRDMEDIYYHMTFEQVVGLISFLKEQVESLENKK